MNRDRLREARILERIDLGPQPGELDAALLQIVVPIGRIESHRPADDRIQPGIDSRNGLEEPRHGTGRNARDDLLSAALVRGRVRHQLEKRAAERKHIAAAIQRSAPHLLRRHVAERADDVARDQRFALENPGDSKVQHLHDAGFVQHEVVRLDVEVDDAGAMRVGQAGARAFDQLEPPAQRERGPAPDQASERLPRHVLHRDVRPAVVLTGVEDGDDVRVPEPPGGARLLHQPSSSDVVIQLASNELDRNLAIEDRVASQIHLRHAAAAEEADHLIPADDSRLAAARLARGLRIESSDGLEECP